MSAAERPAAGPGSGPIEPRGPVVWEGRPVAAVTLSDLVAGAGAFVVTAGVLAGGMALPFGASLGAAARLGVAYGALVGVVTALARAAGASTVLSLLLAFFLPVAVGAGVTGQEGLSLLCPSLTSAVLVLLVAQRFRQRRATRYLVTTDAAVLDAGDVGRYRITFRLGEPPVVVRDRFGGRLGDVDFGRQEATLATRNGPVLRMAPRPRRFHRVRDPERLLAALRAGAPGAAPQTP